MILGKILFKKQNRHIYVFKNTKWEIFNQLYVFVYLGNIPDGTKSLVRLCQVYLIYFLLQV